MYRIQSVFRLAHKFLVIIHNLDLRRVAIVPRKANPPLVVDADAMPALAFPGQRFQPVARRHSQIIQTPRPVQVFQFAPRRVLNVRRQSPRTFPAKDAFGFRTSERDNHQSILSHGDNKSTSQRRPDAPANKNTPAQGRALLISLERTIETGRKTFVEVGLALAEIRDAKLYRAEAGPVTAKAIQEAAEIIAPQNNRELRQTASIRPEACPVKRPPEPSDGPPRIASRPPACFDSGRVRTDVRRSADDVENGSAGG
jgi:hypothetical protein